MTDAHRDAERTRLAQALTDKMLWQLERLLKRDYVEREQGDEREIITGTQAGREFIIETLLDALAAAPAPRETGVYGSEVLCPECAVTFCPHGERLHFHHDGCPACHGTDEAAPAPREMKDYEALYHELLYQVATKHPNETRHQTALRYLRQHEHECGKGGPCAAPPRED